MVARRASVEHPIGVAIAARKSFLWQSLDTCMEEPENPAIARVRDIAERYWQRLIDAACGDEQVANATLLRTEGLLQLALELRAVDMALLLQWGTEAAQRLAAAIPNPLWPDSAIRVDAGDVHIIMLHKRAPVYRSTAD